MVVMGLVDDQKNYNIQVIYAMMVNLGLSSGYMLEGGEIRDEVEGKHSGEVEGHFGSMEGTRRTDEVKYRG